MTLSVGEFGEGLIKTGDLDPVYVAIHGAHLGEDQRAKLLVSYWCFYHLGLAAWMSEHGNNAFWVQMLAAAENVQPSPVGGRWPRAAERRHFRGMKCVEAVEALADRSPLSRIEGLSRKVTEQAVMDEVQRWPMFGPWIAFKVADMLERCCGVPLTFSPGTITMYDEPRKALDLLDSDNPKQAYDHVLSFFARYKAPPGGDRRCGPQEVETVLCKWKSHMGGHYWVGKDIHEVGEGLRGWGETAGRLHKALPPPVVNGHS